MSLGKSLVFEVELSNELQLFKLGGSESRNFLELVGEMCGAALVQFEGDLRQIQLVIQQQFLYFPCNDLVHQSILDV